MARKWISLAIILALVGAGVFAVVRHFRHARVHPSTEDAYVAGDVFPVSARIPGTLLTVEVKENEAVKKGQTLATLDPRDSDQQVDQARTALEAPRVRVPAGPCPT